MISVIIATKDRADALRDISLPSLLGQDCNNFEVIVWDASAGDESKFLCSSLTRDFENKSVALRYFQAPRVGSASQRNDSVKEALGDVVFFIDDDCQISADGVKILAGYFANFPWLKGAGLPMVNKSPKAANSFLLRFATRLFWMKNGSFMRKIAPSSCLSLPTREIAGTAEWLSGGSMAYRKSVFDEMRLDERLQKFGGYALGEDYDFSHRVFLSYNEPLFVTNGGYVVHVAAEGSRPVGKEKVAAHFYNMTIVRRSFNKISKKYGFLAFVWGLIGAFLFLLATKTSIKDIFKGIKLARQAIKNDG